MTGDCVLGIALLVSQRRLCFDNGFALGVLRNMDGHAVPLDQISGREGTFRVRPP